jgi:hypothetical protein
LVSPTTSTPNTFPTTSKYSKLSSLIKLRKNIPFGRVARSHSQKRVFTKAGVNKVSVSLDLPAVLLLPKNIFLL